MIATRLYICIFTLFCYKIIIAQTNSNVGIGTTSPSATLDIISKGTTKALEVNNGKKNTLEMVTVLSNGQIGINAPIPQTSALLELRSDNQALLLTRVASTGTISNPINGMLLYDNSSQCIKSYENNTWSNCLSQ